MLAFGHTSVGVLIGTSAAITYTDVPLNQKIIIVLILGLLSHYVCDYIPHGHYNFKPNHIRFKSLLLLIIDLLAVIALFAYLGWLKFGNSDIYILMITGILAAQLPDIWEGLVQSGFVPKTRLVKLHQKWHYNYLHWHSQSSIRLTGRARPWSVIDSWQVATLALALIVVLRL